MSGKVCTLICECQACSGLSKEDTEKVLAALKADKNTAHAVSVKAPCLKGSQKEIRELPMEGCDRVVVGLWCYPEPSGSVSRLLKKVSPSLIEVVDLSIYATKKIGCAAQVDKYASVLRASAAGLAQAEPLKDRKMPYASKSVIVIGSNGRAVEAAKSLASKGIHTRLISMAPLPAVKAERLEVIDESTTEGLKGIPGDFKVTYSRKGQKREADGASILLVSERCLARVSPPKGSNISIVPLEQFNNYTATGVKVKGMVFLDDLQSLTTVADPVTPSWHSLLETAKTAAATRMADLVTVIARDVKAAGLLELLWKEAADAGVKFVRYDDKSRPKINKEEQTISVKDLVLGEQIDVPADVIVAPITTRPWEPIFIERLYLPSDWDLKSRLRGPQRGTAQSPCEGIFLVGYAGFNELLDIAEPELDSAIAQITAFMRRGYHVARGAVAVIEEGKCSACLTCVRTCPYRAAVMNESWKAEIIAEKCAGCGNCVAVCPSVAIELKNCTRPQIKAQVAASTGVTQ
jgi:heterodisulfide reductase subunit A-like polyferredoxin